MVQMAPEAGHRGGLSQQFLLTCPVHSGSSPPPPSGFLLCWRLGPPSLPSRGSSNDPQSLPYSCRPPAFQEIWWHEPQKGHLEGRLPQGRLGAGGTREGWAALRVAAASLRLTPCLEVRLEGGLSWGLGVTEGGSEPRSSSRGWQRMGLRGKQAPRGHGPE